MKQSLLFFTLISCWPCVKKTYAQPVPQKMAVGQKHAVVTASPFASMDALYMMQHGGNAFDAAITAQWVLAVVYPQAGNLGGGGFMIAHRNTGENLCLDFREVAPSAAHQNMYLDAHGNPQPMLAQEGALASGVPGSVAGIFAMHRWAKLPMSVLMAPAIDYAENGFPVTERMAQELNEIKAEFLRNNRAPVAFVKEEPWKAGDRLEQPELAATLKRISQFGAKDFYEGKTADWLVKEMQASGGLITKEDLANYEVNERVPMRFDYKGHQIVTMPLPSSGGIILQQLLTITNSFGMDRFGYRHPLAIQLAIEAERRVYADRSAYLGDPDFVKVPVKQLTDSIYLMHRMADFQFYKAGNSAATLPGLPHESEETTHLSIVDSAGNAVAITTTLNDSYGSRKVVAGAGFILNNEMDDFSIKPGVPNLYGVTGGIANAIAPGKKMLSSMTPTIVLKENEPVMVLGTPGGSTIPTSVFQTITALIDFQRTPEEAVQSPKFHHQWTPDKVFVEADFPQNTRGVLQQMGYTIKQREAIGRTELIVIEPAYYPVSTLTKGFNCMEFAPVPKKIIAIADKRGDDDAQAE